MGGVADDLARLCSRELQRALKDGDQDAIAGMVERLTHSLSFTIAFGCRGDQSIMGTLLAGVESYLNEGASDMAALSASLPADTEDTP